jgi:hypothetical protein
VKATGTAAIGTVLPLTGTPNPTSYADSGVHRGVFLIIAVALVLLTVVTYVSTRSALATFVVILILIGFIFLLGKLGVLDIYISNGTLNIDYHELESSPAPSSTKGTPASLPKPVVENEVFHVGGNQFTYDDAPAVCAAYDAELATYDQVNDAFAKGAEWCAYGWTQGGMALYPTQEDTWQALQAEPKTRTACGRPGVNGGYFDPATLFGVNCYGVKPADMTNMSYPLALPGEDPVMFKNLVAKFKKMLSYTPVTSFNRDGWSEWNLSTYTTSSSAK